MIILIRKAIESIIYHFKEEAYIIDLRIPLGYLIGLIWRRLTMLLYGYILFQRKIFVSTSARIRCKSKFHFNGVVTIGRNAYVDALSVNGVKFGKNVSIGNRTIIECTGSLQNIGLGLRIGNNVGLGTDGFWGCAGGIEVGDDTIFGNFVSLHSENHNFSCLDIPIRKQGVNRKGIKIGANCWIGAKVTILDGTIIGNGCVVAAGSVVRGQFPDNCVIGGVPAKILKMRYE